MFSTLKVSLREVTILEMASSDATTRWKPPAIKWILGFMVAAASTILSIPGCEQPTTSTSPSGVLTASDSSLSSRVPGTSDTRAINRNRPRHHAVLCELLDVLDVGTPPAIVDLKVAAD